jgi:hypothetical protein
LAFNSKAVNYFQTKEKKEFYVLVFHLAYMYLFFQLQASHELELQHLMERLLQERQKQLLNFRDKMAAEKKRKVANLRRKQEVEITQEMLTQQKELEDIRGKNVSI